MSKLEEERLATLEYYIDLLVKQMDGTRFPWDYLIIRGKLSRRDVQSIYDTCEELSKEMEKQKAEGFVTFSPLLLQFRHALPPGLPWEETINALHSQGLYISLMDEFHKLIKKK
ncbi:hypothetical protein AB685_13910 [Bacillus sp. LL01]|uniref:DUF1878 family protein n=1 Tax=Bacillus sp. LL01 TaxID=1665556 RepID=UPI00064D3CD6|nr:DUF1878 family protein [Bacillus sp. LL01]KMJ57925.1 hypothetical protein AB685_13910 [Bacillus sp. LL01]